MNILYEKIILFNKKKMQRKIWFPLGFTHFKKYHWEISNKSRYWHFELFKIYIYTQKKSIFMLFKIQGNAHFQLFSVSKKGYASVIFFSFMFEKCQKKITPAFRKKYCCFLLLMSRSIFFFKTKQIWHKKKWNKTDHVFP